MAAPSVWSTSNAEARLRFSYWREAVCQTILHVEAERRGSAGFEAHISGFAGGTAKVARFVSKPHRILRNRSHVLRSGESGYLVSWQEAGASRIALGEASVVLEPGDVGIVDVERPFQVDFPEPVRRTLALIPRRWLEEKAPWLKRSPLTRVGNENVFAQLVGAHLVQLGTQPAASPAAIDLLVENVSNLVALATVPAVLERQTCELPTDTMLMFVRKNLHRPELAPMMAAGELGIAARTLHLRFQRLGTTFGAFVLAERLEACRRALGNEMLRQQSISAIAFDWGFREISHFSRAFKARYGASPRDYRSAQRDQA